MKHICNPMNLLYKYPFHGTFYSHAVFKTGWFIALIGAALSVLFAVLVLANPFSSTIILWNFIAIWLIIEAVMDILTFIFGMKQK